jgi:hypothetical protein
LGKARHKKEISILMVAYKRLCGSKNVSGKLNGIPPGELKKFEKLSFTKFYFRPETPVAAIKNVTTLSGLRETLLKIKGL